MKLKFYQVGNSTYTLSIDDTVKIGLDPALEGAGTSLGFGITRKTEPVYTNETFNNVDFWLITHLHGDHIDDLGMSKMEKKLPIITHTNYVKKFKKNNFTSVIGLAWQEVTEIKVQDYIIQIKAIPAYHGHSKLVVGLMKKVNGYMIKIMHKSESKLIYIGSDTVFNELVKNALGKMDNIDLFIATAGEAKAPLPVTKKPITMTIQEVEEFSNWLNAKKTIISHIDDYSHFRSKREDIKAEFIAPLNGEEINIEL
jgi:L-ascorbate metabolism protein UlaG (beta-lactamase superfamily)